MPDSLIKAIDLGLTLDKKKIVSPACFSIYPEEVLTFIGPNGAGKSTLLRLLSLISFADTGRILFSLPGCKEVEMDFNDPKKKISIDQSDILSMRKNILYLFQKPAVFSSSVLNNLHLSGKLRGLKFLEKEYREVLKKVGLSKNIYQNATTLSGGEMSRLAFARALLLKPKVLFLDEPSAHLDPMGVKSVEEWIGELKTEYKTSLFLVTQDLFEAKRVSDRVGFLLSGQLIELNSTKEFFENPKDPKTCHFVKGELPI
jgi:ABC-type phosphate transport system ATPase subunit